MTFLSVCSFEADINLGSKGCSFSRVDSFFSKVSDNEFEKATFLKLRLFDDKRSRHYDNAIDMLEVFPLYILKCEMGLKQTKYTLKINLTL